MMNEAFDAEVLGMKKGQTKEFSLDIAEDESAVLLSAYAGKKINFEVTCVVVKKQTLPEVTDEWAKDVLGFESVEDLKARIAEVRRGSEGRSAPPHEGKRLLRGARETLRGRRPSEHGRGRRRRAFCRSSSRSCSRPASTSTPTLCSRASPLTSSKPM